MQEITTTYSIVLDTFYVLTLLLFLTGIFRELRHFGSTRIKK